MDLQKILATAAAIILSLGGASAIIIAISKWLGQIISNRIIERYKFSHEKDLEGIKNRYSQELEIVKSELDKSKYLFLKYSDKQFELYNSLWKVLWEIKKQADGLWEEATAKKLPKFAKALKSAREALYVNILLIDETHFTRLLSMIQEFEMFQFGKQRLIELREVKKEPKNEEDSDFEDVKFYSKELNTTTNIIITEDQIRQVISQNGNLKSRFDDEIMAISREFRRQIKG